MIKETLHSLVAWTEVCKRFEIDVLINGQQVMLLVTSLLVTIIYFFRVTQTWLDVSKGPVVGYRPIMELARLLSLCFTRESQEILQQGYKQVRRQTEKRKIRKERLFRVLTSKQFKNVIFRVRCNYIEIVVLPYKYIEELRHLPEES